MLAKVVDMLDHVPSLIEMREGPFQALPTQPQQAQAHRFLTTRNPGQKLLERCLQRYGGNDGILNGIGAIDASGVRL